MTFIQSGNYGGSISNRKDGSVDCYLLYNMGQPTQGEPSKGDVWSRKSYKSEKTAQSKIAKWIEENS